MWAVDAAKGGYLMMTPKRKLEFDETKGVSLKEENQNETTKL